MGRVIDFSALPDNGFKRRPVFFLFVIFLKGERDDKTAQKEDIKSTSPAPMVPVPTTSAPISSAPPSPLPTVQTEKLKKMDIPVYLSALGTATPTTSVTVRTQINGQLLRVFFEEGHLVKQGDVLAEIDSRIYDAQLLQYEGQISKDKSLLENALLDLERYKNLAKKGAVSKQTLDTQASLVHQCEGTVKSDQGLIDGAKLKQTYCKITAPVSGRVGLRLVDPGNYVQTTDSKGLVVLNVVNPISVVFSLPESHLKKLLDKSQDSKKLVVEALDQNQKNTIATGTLDSMDNQVDLSTGTVKLRALFDNPHDVLFPNQFVNVNVLIDTLKNQWVVPTTAIQKTPNGTLVYKLNPDQTVTAVPVVIKATYNDVTAIQEDAIQSASGTSGPSAGNPVQGKFTDHDSVIVDGMDKIKDGSRVHVSESQTQTNSNTTNSIGTTSAANTDGLASPKETEHKPKKDT